MAKENDKKQSGGKIILSVIVLSVILLGAFFLAPRLQQFLEDRKQSEAVDAAEVVTDTSVPSKVGNAGPQAPRVLKAWVQLIERQLPKDGEIKFRLLHIRLSDDRSRLLVDLELIGAEENDRIDLILERDEFGRYISDNDELPMKLYPPEALELKKPELTKDGEPKSSAEASK